MRQLQVLAVLAISSLCACHAPSTAAEAGSSTAVWRGKTRGEAVVHVPAEARALEASSAPTSAARRTIWRAAQRGGHELTPSER